VSTPTRDEQLSIAADLRAAFPAETGDAEDRATARGVDLAINALLYREEFQ
jgi:hypothetical protein